jgi:hypothetical protein
MGTERERPATENSTRHSRANYLHQPQTGDPRQREPSAGRSTGNHAATRTRPPPAGMPEHCR